MPYKILLADSHPVVHAGLRSVFAAEPEFEIVDAVSQLDQLAQSAHVHQPNVLITDVRIDGKDVLKFLAKIIPTQKSMVVVVFSHHQDSFHVARAGALGCYEYVCKSCCCLDLVNIVKNGVHGVPVAATSLIKCTRARMRDRRRRMDDQSPLTQREMQVIRHIANGLKNREIGQSLEISVETVKEHVQNILRKLKVNDRTQAAVMALKKDWI